MEIYRKGFIQTCQAEGRVVRKPRPGRKHMKEPNLDQQSRGEEPRREKPTMLDAVVSKSSEGLCCLSRDQKEGKQ